MRNRLFTILIVLVALVFGVRGFFLGAKSARAQEPSRAWQLYESSTAASMSGRANVVKIQDGPCSIYVTYISSVHGAGTSIALGPGCK